MKDQQEIKDKGVITRRTQTPVCLGEADQFFHISKNKAARRQR